MRFPLVVILLGVMQVIGWATSFYLPATLGEAIAADLRLSNEVVYGGMTMMVLIVAATAPVVGKFLDRGYARPALIAATLAACVGLLLIGSAQGIGGYVAGWVFLGITCTLGLSGTVNVALIRMAPERARSAITWLSLVTGLSSTVALPVTASLLTVMDWRHICYVFAAAQIVLCLPAYWWVLPASEPVAVSGVAMHATTQQAEGIPEFARRRVFILFSAAFALNGLIAWGIPVHMIRLFEAQGVTPHYAVLAASFFGASQVVSRIIDILRGRRSSIVSTAVIGVVLLPLSVLPLLFAGGTFTASLMFVMIYGGGVGLLSIARTLWPLLLYGRSSYATWVGRLSVPMQIANAASPVILASLGRAGPTVIVLFILVTTLATATCIITLARYSTRVMAAAESSAGNR